MRPRLIVLRPEPGNRATCERIRAAGGEAVALPLFEVRPIDWTPPDPDAFDALLLTSANAARHAGPRLAAFAHLPVVTVGEATAGAARAVGLRVIATGTGDAGEATNLLTAHGFARTLHLSGREHRSPIGDVVPVYASEPLSPPTLDPLTDATALLHSPRAAARLAELVDAANLDRSRIALAAISANALAAGGSGWRNSVVATTIGDAPLIAAALSIDRNRCGGDKAP